MPKKSLLIRQREMEQLTSGASHVDETHTPTPTYVHPFIVLGLVGIFLIMMLTFMVVFSIAVTRCLWWWFHLAICLFMRVCHCLCCVMKLGRVNHFWIFCIVESISKPVKLRVSRRGFKYG